MKDLQNIKEEVAVKGGYKDWMELMRMTGDFGQDTASDQVAIRYANEQNRELVEMLELTRQMCVKRQFPTENELKEIAEEIEELITKHKQS